MFYKTDANKVFLVVINYHEMEKHTIHCLKLKFLDIFIFFVFFFE